MTTPASTPVPLTRAATNAAFIYVVDVIIDSVNVTSSLAEDGIDDVVDILTLDDATITIIQPHLLKRGEIGPLRTFLHFVHYREEINNPIDNKWTCVAQDEFN
jgi:hypothetical protein